MKQRFTIEGLDDNDDSELSCLKRELFKVLYDNNTSSLESFIKEWNRQIHEKIKLTEPTIEDLDPNSEVQTPLRTLGKLILNPYKGGGNPLQFLEDIFPKIWGKDEYPWYIQGLSYTKSMNTSDDFLDGIKEACWFLEEDPFKRFKVILVEATYGGNQNYRIIRTSKDPPKNLKLDFNEKLTFGPEFTEDKIEQEYRLVSVIEHQRTGLGRYNAYVRRARPNNSKKCYKTRPNNFEKWYKTSDTDVEAVSYADIKRIPLHEFLIYELVENQ